MIKVLKAYKLVLAFCLILIVSIIGASLNKIRNHKSNIFDKDAVVVAVNDDTVETPVTDDETTYFNLDASDVTFMHTYDGYYDRHNIDRFGDGEEAEQTEEPVEMAVLPALSEGDFIDIIYAIQSTSENSYNGTRLTDNMLNILNEGSLRVVGFEDIERSKITIKQLGIADDGTFIGKVVFNDDDNNSYNISGVIINNQVDSLQIF